MSDFRNYLNEQLKNPEFKAEWEAMTPEYQAIRAILDARQKANLSQQQLAELAGMSPEDINRLETGNASPSLRTLQRIAAGLNMALKLEFVPLQQTAP